MKREEGLAFNNPMPYIFLVFILSSITYEMYSYNKLQAIFVACSFFVLLFMYKGKVVTIIISIFFTIALCNNFMFYNYTPESTEEIRIDEVKAFLVKGKIKGRNIEVSLEDSNVKKGQNIIVKGSFVKNQDLSTGKIGKYIVDEYSILQDDFIAKLYKQREDIYNAIEIKLGSRKAALVTSVAFGYSEYLDGEDKEDMQTLGVTHAISVSGLHMVLVYGILKNFFGSYIALAIAFLYVIFTGAASATIRSYIMILIMSGGMLFKRNYNPLAALSLAGILLLIINPYQVFSLGFILSFLATLGIVLFNKELNKRLFRLPKYLRTTISMSIATQVLTFPIIILTFNEFSLNFLTGNLVILPILNILVILGNLTIVFWKLEFVFNYILYLTHYCIKIMDFFIDYFWNINLDTLYLNYTFAYFYIALLIAYYFYKKGHKKFIYFPLITMIYILVLMYNPIPSIRYYREGALLFSYKGERVLLQTKAIVDKQKLKKVAMVEKVYSEANKIVIGKNIVIKKSGKNYTVGIKDKEYLLMVNYEKRNEECDIIDFRDGDLQEVWVFNERIIARR